MSIIRPTLRFDFANNPGFIDPRATFGRASTAVYWDRHGIQRTAPANTPRFDFDPVTGLCRGYLSENPRTNLFLRSRTLDHAAWTQTNIAVTADQAVAADGTAALEELAATGANGAVSQGCTISAGDTVTVSFYVRASLSQFALLTVGDGTNSVSCWFNLGSGAAGTSTAGAGTCVFAFKDVENCGGGLYRISLTVTTATSTAFVATLGPASADGVATANLDEIYGGDAQFEVGSHASSFIVTTTGTVTRSGDYLSLPTTGSWWNATEGAITLDFLVTRRTPTTSAVFGGIGDTFANTIYISRSGNEIYETAISASVQQAIPNRTLTWTIGTRNRVGVRWKANDFAMVANGGSAATDTAGSLPVAPARIMVGAAPYSATGGTNYNDCISGFSYFPRALSTPSLQTLTAA